jgi:hypothetical protein
MPVPARAVVMLAGRKHDAVLRFRPHLSIPIPRSNLQKSSPTVAGLKAGENCL